MAAQYWRLLFQRGSNNQGNISSDFWYCMVGLEMRQTQGGANAATGGTATASTNWDSNYDAPKALGTYASGRWWGMGLSNGDVWWKYQFTGPVDIEEITLTGNVGNRPDMKTPQRLILQSSPDNATWTTKYAWVIKTPWVTNGTDTRVFNGSNTENAVSNWSRIVS